MVHAVAKVSHHGHVFHIHTDHLAKYYPGVTPGLSVVCMCVRVILNLPVLRLVFLPPPTLVSLPALTGAAAD